MDLWHTVGSSKDHSLMGRYPQTHKPKVQGSVKCGNTEHRRGRREQLLTEVAERQAELTDSVPRNGARTWETGQSLLKGRMSEEVVRLCGMQAHRLVPT